MSGMCGRDCSKCTLHQTCGGCSLCERPYCEEQCYSCFALCPTRPGSFSLLNSIGGPELELLSNDEIELPCFVPVLPDRLKEQLSYDHVRVVGLHAGEMFLDSGSSVAPSYLKNGYAAALNIDSKIEAVLQFYTKDRTLEGFYDHRHVIYDQLLQMKLKAVIAPNFSVYEDAPRLDHMYNMKRSVTVYSEMIERGLPAIPDVSYYDANDLKQWIREITNKGIKIISFSFQNVDVKLKASNLWKHYLLGFRILCTEIPKDVDVIIVGASSTRRIKEIISAAPGRIITVLNQAAYVQSRRGMISKDRSKAPHLSKHEILVRNIEYFSTQYYEYNKESIYAETKIEQQRRQSKQY